MSAPHNGPMLSRRQVLGVRLGLAAALLLTSLTGCMPGQTAAAQLPAAAASPQTAAAQPTVAAAPAPAAAEHPVPQELKVIPEEYYQAADQQGTLMDLYYDTYESFSYAEKSAPLQKHAVVYLPYGYSQDQQYDVFYLMHGGWTMQPAILHFVSKRAIPTMEQRRWNTPITA